MVALAAYFDDAGTHDGSLLVNVSGVIASVPQWVDFSKAWKRKLDDLGLDFFRMADFVSGYGPYAGWTEPKKRQTLVSFVKIITKHARHLVGNAVFSNDFKTAYAEHPSPCIKTPYHLCAAMAMPAVGYWKLASSRREPVALIFESGNKLFDEYFRLAQNDFANDLAREAYGIKSLTLGKKKEMFPLQAADIVAYGNYKCATQKSIEPYLADAYTLLWGIKNSGRVWSQEDIGRILKSTIDDLEKRSHLYTGMFRRKRKSEAPNGNPTKDARDNA